MGIMQQLDEKYYQNSGTWPHLVPWTDKYGYFIASMASG